VQENANFFFVVKISNQNRSEATARKRANRGKQRTETLECGGLPPLY
jgi:hypothetical protein